MLFAGAQWPCARRPCRGRPFAVGTEAASMLGTGEPQIEMFGLYTQLAAYLTYLTLLYSTWVLDGACLKMLVLPVENSRSKTSGSPLQELIGPHQCCSLAGWPFANKLLAGLEMLFGCNLNIEQFTSL